MFIILFFMLSYKSDIWKVITVIGIFHYYITSEKDYSYWLAQQITFKQILAQENMINEPKKLVKKVNEY